MTDENQIIELTNIIHHVLFAFRTERCRELAEQIHKANYRKMEEGGWMHIRNGKGICIRCNRQDAVDGLAHFCRYCGAEVKCDDEG